MKKVKAYVKYLVSFNVEDSATDQDIMNKINDTSVISNGGSIEDILDEYIEDVNIVSIRTKE